MSQLARLEETQLIEPLSNIWITYSSFAIMASNSRSRRNAEQGSAESNKSENHR